MEPQTIQLLTAAATVLGVREGIAWLARWAAGGADREKARFRELSRERDEADGRADREASLRRHAEERCSRLMRALIVAGIPIPEDEQG